MEKINEKIQQKLKTDQKFLDKMQRPCSVFATFETEEGTARARLYNDFIKTDDYARYETMLGQKIEIQEAAEPSDIIWQNRSFTESQRSFKKVVISGIILVLLLCCFTVIFLCQKKSLGL